MRYVNKSLEWIPLPGLNRQQIIDELTKTSVLIEDKGNHVWAAMINNLGTILYCFALQVGSYNHNGREINVFYIKRIPEASGPDVYDCSQNIMEMCKITNVEWRQVVMSNKKD